jgi:hypothetical protein
VSHYSQSRFCVLPRILQAIRHHCLLCLLYYRHGVVSDLVGRPTLLLAMMVMMRMERVNVCLFLILKKYIKWSKIPVAGTSLCVPNCPILFFYSLLYNGVYMHTRPEVLSFGPLLLIIRLSIFIICIVYCKGVLLLEVEVSLVGWAHHHPWAFHPGSLVLSPKYMTSSKCLCCFFTLLSLLLHIVLSCVCPFNFRFEILRVHSLRKVFFLLYGLRNEVKEKRGPLH